MFPLLLLRTVRGGIKFMPKLPQYDAFLISLAHDGGRGQNVPLTRIRPTCTALLGNSCEQVFLCLLGGFILIFLSGEYKSKQGRGKPVPREGGKILGSPSPRSSFFLIPFWLLASFFCLFVIFFLSNLCSI